jgi:hypothetical protein
MIERQRIRRATSASSKTGESRLVLIQRVLQSLRPLRFIVQILR